MKDSFFEMLLNLFEKTLTKLKETESELNQQKKGAESTPAMEINTVENKVIFEKAFLKPSSSQSIRLFTYDEQMKFTKASYQFLMRLLAWEVIDREALELIIDQLMLSDLRFIKLEDTKWTIRQVLSEYLSADQLAFLDLVLYQKKENTLLH